MNLLLVSCSCSPGDPEGQLLSCLKQLSQMCALPTQVGGFTEQQAAKEVLNGLPQKAVLGTPKSKVLLVYFPRCWLGHHTATTLT